MELGVKPRKFTRAEFEYLVREVFRPDERLELIDGYIVELPPETDRPSQSSLAPDLEKKP